jgi:hypothetical protein
MAVAMSISAIPVVAKMLMDMNLLKTPLGHVIIGAAVVNDLIGWIFFAIILSMLGSGTVAGGSIAVVAAMTLGFAFLCLTAGKSLMSRLFSFFHVLRLPPEGILGLAVLTAFLCAAIAQWIGIHAIFGAFLAGIMIGETGEIANHTRDTVPVSICPDLLRSHGDARRFYKPLRLFFGVRRARDWLCGEGPRRFSGSGTRGYEADASARDSFRLDASGRHGDHSGLFSA